MKRFLMILLILACVFFSKNASCDEVNKTETIGESLKQEVSSLVDAIQRGEKVTHGSVVFDVPKLKELQEKGDLENFEIVFEGDKVGLKFHQEEKKGALFSSAVPEKYYLLLMPRQNFETFLAAMLKKEIKDDDMKAKEKSDNPHEWVFEDTYPDFLVMDKDGVRTTMTDKNDATRMLSKVTDTFCTWNSQGVINVGDIVKGYEAEIKENGGWIGEKTLALIGSSSWVQNRLIQNILEPFFEDEFCDLALGCGERRKKAQEVFEKEKKEAVEKYDTNLKLAEERRLASLQTVGDVRYGTIEKYKNEEILLSLLCDEASNQRILITVQNGQIIEKKIEYLSKDEDGWKYTEKRNLEPEEWDQVIPLLNNLSEEKIAVNGISIYATLSEELEMKKEWLGDVFKAIQEQTGVQSDSRLSKESDAGEKNAFDKETEDFLISICSLDYMKKSDTCKSFKKLWQQRHCSKYVDAYCRLLEEGARMINADRTCGRGKRILTTPQYERAYNNAKNGYGRFCCSLDWDFSDLAKGAVCSAKR